MNLAPIMEKETYLWIVSGYIEMNPVRAGLVSRPEQWKWSSAKAHLLGEPSKYLRLKQWLTEEEREGYRVFIDERLREKEISNVRRSTSTGRPLGTKKFVLRAEKRLGRILFPKKRGRKSIK